MIRAELIRALHAMSEKDALDLVQALGQWADNQRNHLDESDPEEIPPPVTRQLAIVETFVDAGESALIATVDRSSKATLQSLDGWVTI